MITRECQKDLLGWRVELGMGRGLGWRGMDQFEGSLRDTIYETWYLK